MENDKNSKSQKKKKHRQRDRPKNKANVCKIGGDTIQTSSTEVTIVANPSAAENNKKFNASISVGNGMPPATEIVKNCDASGTEKLQPTEGNDILMKSFQNEMDKLGNSLKNAAEFPSTLFENLQKLIDQKPVSDVESSDDEDEYVEYIYQPRKYFLVSLCNFCKCDLVKSEELLPCSRCRMTYYCSAKHMKSDESHRQLCYGLRQVADSYGVDAIFYKCADFSSEQFRSYRILAIRKTEDMINRKLSPAEQEVILFPRICSKANCREYRFGKLTDCPDCGQVAFCINKPDHLSQHHYLWCKAYSLFKEMVMFQEKFGRLEPSLPSKVLKLNPMSSITTKDILRKLAFDVTDPLEYAALSQISTGPLTAWNALKLCDKLNQTKIIVHLIGAEIEFEVDVLHKWELFFMHITPEVKCLEVIFIGPELNKEKISFDKLKKTKCCKICRRNERIVNYDFENHTYHDYVKTETFSKPNLSEIFRLLLILCSIMGGVFLLIVCFFNPGLYRSFGYQTEDTWPETITTAIEMKCPIVVTAYTKYEAPLDLSRVLQESSRHLNVVVPPTINPFASDKPERSFIHDEEAPLMFKNFYYFIVE